MEVKSREARMEGIIYMLITTARIAVAALGIGT
jgi:hypothetical protein